MTERTCIDCGAIVTRKPGARGRIAERCLDCKRSRQRQRDADRRDTPCSICGKLLYSSRTSLPPERRTCLDCRRSRRPADPPFQTWTCRDCGAESSRPSTIGRVPWYCDACPTARITPTPCVDCGTPTLKERCNPCARGAHSDKRGTCTDCGQLRVLDSGRCIACVIEARPEPMTRWERAERRRDSAAAGHPSSGVWTVGRCHYCGCVFTVRAGRPARFCSKRCQALDKGSRRRARAHDVWIGEVNRFAVFERHAWTCHICGDPIDRTLPANDPMSGSLDHVIPLVGRGPHVESNLRPAHMMCNSLKSLDDVGVPLSMA